MDLYIQTNAAIMRQIGSKLKELRIEKNMKQKELADAAGVSVLLSAPLKMARQLPCLLSYSC